MGLELSYIKFINSHTEKSGGTKMLELGNQRISPNPKINFSTGKEYYQSLGYEHVSVDVNGLDGSLKLDLREPTLFSNYINYFNIITNCGTTEHIEPFEKQFTSFKLLHDLLQPNGIFVHIIPEYNDRWKSHCQYFYSKDFFEMLAKENNYEILEFKNLNDLLGVALQKKSSNNFMTNKDLFYSKINFVRDASHVYKNAVYPNTMVSRNKVKDLATYIDIIADENVEGDYIECGTYRGGLSALMLDQLIYRKLDKKLWIYDTFQGMSEPTDLDISVKDENAKTSFDVLKNETTGCADWCKATIDIVESTLNIVTNDFRNYTKFIIGKVEDTLINDANVPKTISLMRLDTDWYDSTKIELETLYHRLSINGYVIIDDYGYWKGQKLATDEFFDKLDKDSYTITDGDDGSIIIKKLK